MVTAGARPASPRGGEEDKPSVLTDDTFVNVSHPKGCADKPLELLNQFCKVTRQFTKSNASRKTDDVLKKTPFGKR